MNAQQLRNSILQEAIEGRLVPQDPNDEPASVLLERIREEKKRLVKEGKLKKKDLIETPISEDEKPFDIPDSWEWVRIKAILSLQAGKNVTSADIHSEQNDVFRYPCYGGNGLRGYVKNYNNEGFYPLIGRQGALCGNVNMAHGQFWATEHAVVADGWGMTDVKWQYFFLIALNLNKYATATAQPGLAVSNIIEVPIPLPPLAEQKRIVAKIEELLPKVEEYGKAQEALDKLNEELPEKLKKSVLQEAITGKLVPQDPNDEPASVLLERIREEKKRLVKEGKLKKKDLEEKPVSEDEKPFEIPDSWEWFRLGDIGLFERGNGIKRDETFESGYPCVRYGEMYTKYKYAPTFEKTASYTCKSVFEKCRKAHKGDLFMALTGENKQDISLAAQYVGDEEIAVGGDLCHFSILEAYGLYFVYLINSKYFSSKKELLATGDIIVHISTDKLASIPIPLPPLAEQKRIVEKLEQLLGEIDKLNNN